MMINKYIHNICLKRLIHSYVLNVYSVGKVLMSMVISYTNIYFLPVEVKAIAVSRALLEVSLGFVGIAAQEFGAESFVVVLLAAYVVEALNLVIGNL